MGEDKLKYVLTLFWDWVGWSCMKTKMYPLGLGLGWGPLSLEEIASRKLASAKEAVDGWAKIAGSGEHNLSSNERSSVVELVRSIRQSEPSYVSPICNWA